MIDLLLKVDWKKQWPSALLLIALAASNGYTIPELLGIHSKAETLSDSASVMVKVIADQAAALSECRQ